MAFDKNGNIIRTSSKDVEIDALGGVNLDDAVKWKMFGNDVKDTLEGGEHNAPPSVAAVNTGLSKKADKADVDNKLSSKADKTSVDNALSQKAGKSELASKADVSALANKQDKLVNGSNIKTINNQSILGSGNINIQGGSGGGVDIDTTIPASPSDSKVPSTKMLVDNFARKGSGGGAVPDAGEIPYKDTNVGAKLTELEEQIDKQEDEAINIKEDGTSSYYAYSFLKGYTYDVSISPKSTTSIKTCTKTAASYIVDTIRVAEGKASFVATDFAYFLSAPASSVVKIIEHKKIEKYDTKKYFPILSSLKRDSNANPNSIVLAHISDIHGSKANLKSFVDFISQYKSIINDSICSGDIVNVEATDSLKFWYDCNAENILTCIGNHDTRINGDWYAVSELDSYKRFMVGYSNDDGVTPLDPSMYQRWGVTLGGNNVCYYHKDYGNLRVITLDCMHYDSSQASWLTSLLTSSVDKHVLIVSHVRGANEYTSSGNNFDNLDDHDTTIWNQVGAAAIVQSFIDSGGVFIGWICGHTHDDQCGWLKSFPSQFHITISCQKSPSATNEGTIGGINRMVGSEYQDCINLYSVDTTNKTLRVLRVGVNKDRYMRDITSMIYDYGNNNLVK